MSSENEFSLTGTLIWYYYCCLREVWLLVHQINADQDDGNMDLGRFIHENTYNRDKQKEISIGNIKLDIVRQDKDSLVIGEVKKVRNTFKALVCNWPFHYFNHYGYYTGTFYPREHYNSGYMILRQAEHYLNPESRLHIARQFVTGAERNIRQVLKYYANRNKNVEEQLSEIE